MTVHHDPAARQFTTGPAQDPAELAYSLPAPATIDFTHTFVPAARRGQGAADALARAALTYARRQHLHVRTSCPFMAAFVQRHPELVGVG